MNTVARTQCVKHCAVATFYLYHVQYGVVVIHKKTAKVTQDAPGKARPRLPKLARRRTKQRSVYLFVEFALVSASWGEVSDGMLHVRLAAIKTCFFRKFTFIVVWQAFPSCIPYVSEIGTLAVCLTLWSLASFRATCGYKDPIPFIFNAISTLPSIADVCRNVCTHALALSMRSTKTGCLCSNPERLEIGPGAQQRGNKTKLRGENKYTQ